MRLADSICKEGFRPSCDKLRPRVSASQGWATFSTTTTAAEGGAELQRAMPACSNPASANNPRRYRRRDASSFSGGSHRWKNAVLHQYHDNQNLLVSTRARRNKAIDRRTWMRATRSDFLSGAGTHAKSKICTDCKRNLESLDSPSIEARVLRLPEYGSAQEALAGNGRVFPAPTCKIIPRRPWAPFSRDRSAHEQNPSPNSKRERGRCPNTIEIRSEAAWRIRGIARNQAASAYRQRRIPGMLQEKKVLSLREQLRNGPD